MGNSEKNHYALQRVVRAGICIQNSITFQSNIVNTKYWESRKSEWKVLHELWIEIWNFPNFGYNGQWFSQLISLEVQYFNRSLFSVAVWMLAFSMNLNVDIRPTKRWTILNTLILFMSYFICYQLAKYEY